MNCNEIQEKLTAGETLDDESAAHLRTCADCAAVAEVCRLLTPQEGEGAPVPSEALDGRVRDACRGEVAALPRRRLWRRILRVCYAAAALVVLFIGVSVVHTEGNRPPQPSATDVLPDVDSGLVVDASLLVTNDQLEDLNVELTLAVLGDEF